jgi:Rps23 Pro-64 3,4-dihydroxylase Tpa1-like proline 4-hydroxylase
MQAEVSSQQFVSSRVGIPAREDPLTRASESCVLSKLKSWYRDYVDEWVDALLPVLGVDAFQIEDIELQVTRHRIGGYYRCHHDVSRREASRRVTLVHYLFDAPRPFRGGDLLLYDTDVAGLRTDTNRFTRVPPASNRAVWFPSCVAHEVTEVRAMDLDSAATDAPSQWPRVALNCWIHDGGEAGYNRRQAVE